MDKEKVIEIKSLSKKFGKIKAVDDLDLTVYRGDVFGFLGPNGAGKSTSIRMMLSLIFPDAGSIKILGKELFSNRLDILKRVGAIVEKPDFYKYLTAYKNLEILGRLSGIDVTETLIMEKLELVGLEERYDSKVKTFSHGMKQRLGIAQALLHDPELIILDEPTTGLDPQGMREIRELIKSLSKDHYKTVVLSSHLLYEVEQTADRMIIMNKGKTIVQGSVNDILTAEDNKITFTVDKPENAIRVIEQKGYSDSLFRRDENRIELKLKRSDSAALNKAMVEAGIEVESIVPLTTLEEFFINITEEA